MPLRLVSLPSPGLALRHARRVRAEEIAAGRSTVLAACSCHPCSARLSARMPSRAASLPRAARRPESRTELTGRATSRSAARDHACSDPDKVEEPLPGSVRFGSSPSTRSAVGSHAAVHRAPHVGEHNTRRDIGTAHPGGRSAREHRDYAPTVATAPILRQFQHQIRLRRLKLATPRGVRRAPHVEDRLRCHARRVLMERSLGMKSCRQRPRCQQPLHDSACLRVFKEISHGPHDRAGASS